MQIPVATIVIVVPETVQTPAVLEVTVTGIPLSEVGDITGADAPHVMGVIAVNAIVWAIYAAKVKLCVCDAVNMAPLEIVTIRAR